MNLLGQSLKGGFQTANRSWAGMLVYAGSLVVIVSVAILAFVIGSLSTGVLQQLPEVVKTYGQIQNQDPTAASQNMDQIRKAFVPWLSRIWPALLVSGLLVVVSGVWIYCGQVSYLAKLIREGSAQISEFWAGPIRTLVPVFLAGLLSIGILGALVAAIASVAALLSQISRPFAWVFASLSVIVAIGLLIWLGVRLSFCYISIVADRLGPISGLWASFKITKGHWWYTFGFFVVIALISFAVGAGFQILVRGTGKMDSWSGLILGVPAALLSVGINLYMNFFKLASKICFYNGLKAGGEISRSSSVTGPAMPPGTP